MVCQALNISPWCLAATEDRSKIRFGTLRPESRAGPENVAVMTQKVGGGGRPLPTQAFTPPALNCHRQRQNNVNCNPLSLDLTMWTEEQKKPEDDFTFGHPREKVSCMWLHPTLMWSFVRLAMIVPDEVANISKAVRMVTRRRWLLLHPRLQALYTISC